MSRDKDVWENLGITDPYYAVATFDNFRSAAIDEKARREFFESGSRHVAEVWSEIESRFDVELRPKHALDYGCGVGRISLPMAAKCGRVTGVDISRAMLNETRRNMTEKGIENISLQTTEEFENADADIYDFVHTYIVLQHVNPSVGCGIIEKITQRLAPGGFGMIHITHTNLSSPLRRLRFTIYRDVPFVHRFLNALRGRSKPLMPMYEYDRDRVRGILDANACTARFEVPTDHGFLGEMIFFRKSSV